MRHLIDPADFTLEETLSLMDLADRIHDDPAAYKDVAARKRLATLFYDCLLYTSPSPRDCS